MIHIALCHDNNYAPYSSVVIASIIDNNKEEKITFHLLHTNLTKERCDTIKAWVEGFQGKHVCFYQMQKETFRDFPIDENTYLDYGAYIRLYLGECLPHLDKVIYLDCDIIVRGQLTELWNTDISEYAVAGVRDRINDYIRVYNRLRYPMADGYINSGMMLINLKRWREDGFFRKAQQVACERGADVLKNHDQDIINAIYHGQILMLPFRYNLLEYYLYVEEWLYLDHKYYPEIGEACQHPVIVHFCMPQKPWHYECINPFKTLYYKYRKMTPWPEVVLTHKQRKLSRKEKVKRLLGKLGLYHIECKPTLRNDIRTIEAKDNVLF